MDLDKNGSEQGAAQADLRASVPSTHRLKTYGLRGARERSLSLELRVTNAVLQRNPKS
jgi:hypothetical protein